MTDATSLSEGFARTAQLATYCLIGACVGFGAVAALAIFAPRFRKPTVPQPNTRTRCNWLGRPTVDGGEVWDGL